SLPSVHHPGKAPDSSAFDAIAATESRTEEADQRSLHRAGSGDTGGGYRWRSELRRSAISP
ncbi:MAG: hypothetical protein M3516_02985, partial [Actinomycetota bacterium]|nr:hypothetical protein [Actinomycetota bacterium]